MNYLYRVEDLKNIDNETANIENLEIGGGSLLNAIKRSQVQRTDREITDVLSTFLHSDVSPLSFIYIHSHTNFLI